MSRAQSLNERIVMYFYKHRGKWINGGEIERLAMGIGYKGSTASRELRHLAEKGHLLREEKKGQGVRSVWYMLKADVNSPTH